MKKLLRKIITTSLFFTIVFLLFNCGNPSLVNESMNVDENSWDVNQKLKIDINIDDTSSTYNFYINVRNTADYKYSNFFLFIKTTFPDGKTAIDTLECILADISGKWIGKGNDKIIDNRILFKKDAIFPAKGKYVFEIEHAMRDKIISGIKSVGLQIEKNKTR